MEDIIGRLEDRVSAVRHEKKPVIYFEKNDALVGLHHIPALYDAITRQQPVSIIYQSFKNPVPQAFTFSPYSFGGGIKVLAPKELVDSIGKRIRVAAKLYE